MRRFFGEVSHAARDDVMGLSVRTVQEARAKCQDVMILLIASRLTDSRWANPKENISAIRLDHL